MQEDRGKYSWILKKRTHQSTCKCSRNHHLLKKKNPNKPCFYTSEMLNKVHLKESEPAKRRFCCCPWILCCHEPLTGLGLSRAVDIPPHAHFISLLIANFLSINYKVQPFPYWVWNREWGLTLEQKLSNSPVHSVHLRPRTCNAKRHIPPLSGKFLWN